MIIFNARFENLHRYRNNVTITQLGNGPSFGLQELIIWKA